jgi:transposase InsO family protein
MSVINDIRSVGMWKYLRPDAPAPIPATDAEGFEEYDKADIMGMRLLQKSLDEELQPLLLRCSDTKEMWENILHHFERKDSTQRLINIYMQLIDTIKSPTEDIFSRINQLNLLLTELKTVQENVPTQMELAFLFASLPESFQPLVKVLIRESDQTWQKAVGQIMEEVERTKDKQQLKQETALFNCFNCNKAGHIKRDCPERKKTFCKKCNRWTYHSTEQHRGPLRKTDNRTAQPLRKTDNRTAQAHSTEHKENALMITNAETVNLTQDERWVIDSACTKHITKSSTNFVDYTPSGGKILVGNGGTEPILGRGTVRIRGQEILDVLHAEKISRNLLSVPEMMKKGHKIVFEGIDCRVFDKKGKLKITGTLGPDSLVTVDNFGNHDTQTALVHDAIISNEAELWHRRFNHVNMRCIAEMASCGTVKGLKIPRGSYDFCQDCVEAKMHKLPTTKTAESKATCPLQRIFIDTKTVEVPSISGYRYFLLIIDDFSRMKFGYYTRTRDEQLAELLKFKNMAERKWPKHKLKLIQTVRSDGAGEFTSRQFEKFLAEHGIIHEKRAADSPNQLGVAERAIRTIFEMVNAMLRRSQLEPKYWLESAMNAIHTLNRCATTGVPKGSTPYELWTGHKPSVAYFRCFGSKCFARVDDKQRKVLNNKTIPCIMLGYEGGGYRLLNKATNKIIIRRHVIFDERNLMDNEVQQPILQPTPSNTPEEKQTDDEKQPEVDLRRSTRVNLGHPPERLSYLMPGTFEEHIAAICHHTQYKEIETAVHGSIFLMNNADDPNTYDQAMTSPDKQHWMEAMSSEIQKLTELDTWELVPRPDDKPVVKSRWVFTRKKDTQGNIKSYKARHVAKGFTQTHGEDYWSTYAPVARLTTLRIVLNLAAQLDMDLHQIDFVSAYLNGKIEEEIYVEQPKGYEEPGKEGYVCRLNRALYGTKQAGSVWNHTFSQKMLDLGYKRSTADRSLFIKRTGQQMTMVLLHVDDGIIASSDPQETKFLKEQLNTAFKMKDLGNLTYFLGLEIQRNRSNKTIVFHQTAYSKEILNRYGLHNLSPVRVPMDPKTVLCKGENEEETEAPYRQVLGSLMYLMVATRPDLSFVTTELAQFMAKPKPEHWKALKSVLRYLSGTTSLGLTFGSSKTDLQILGYSDANFARDIDTRKSITGYCFFMGKSLISWNTRKQPTVALNTAEAEYMALSAASNEALWLRRLSQDIHGMDHPDSLLPTDIHVDNTAAISHAENYVINSRNKHIDIRTHSIAERIESGEIVIIYVNTKEMIADTLTKPLPENQFRYLRNKMGMTFVS